MPKKNCKVCGGVGTIPWPTDEYPDRVQLCPACTLHELDDGTDPRCRCGWTPSPDNQGVTGQHSAHVAHEKQTA